MTQKIQRDQLLQNLTNLSSLSGQHLRQAIEKYNLIICTPTFVLDTTNYNLAEETSPLPTLTIINGGDNGDTVTLIKDSLNGNQVGTGGLKRNHDGYIVISVKTITKIIIKSRRNFMDNQQEVKAKKG